MKWYEDAALVSELPLRYQAYAFYSRITGEKNSRRVPGGSFLLRAIRDASALTRASTVATIRGIDGLKVVADFSDERILEVIHEIRGENPEYQVMKSLLPPGGTFVDVGANFGTFSLLASRLVGAKGRVVAFEPQARLVSMIRRSLDLSGISNCELHSTACGRVPGSRALLIPDDDSGRAGFFAQFSGRKAHSVESVTVVPIDDLRLTEAALIKIDVEGSELDVLEGAARTIHQLKPAIMIEINPSSAAAAGNDSAAVIARLSDLGYSSFSRADDTTVRFAASRVPLDRQSNIIAYA